MKFLFPALSKQWIINAFRTFQKFDCRLWYWLVCLNTKIFWSIKENVQKFFIRIIRKRWINSIHISSRSSVLILEYSLQRRRKWSVVSVFTQHLHIGSIVSLKPCLNLCSFKWLQFNLRRVSSLRPLMSWTAKTDFSLGLIKLMIVSLNLFTDTMFRISSLKAHHCLIEYG